jgi:hypothetical protein
MISLKKIIEGFEDELPGGVADKKKPSDFDKEDLMQGIHVEMEHTDDIALAMEIAMDHLAEDPDYYKKLAMIHDEEKETDTNLRKVCREGGRGEINELASHNHCFYNCRNPRDWWVRLFCCISE